MRFGVMKRIWLLAECLPTPLPVQDRMRLRGSMRLARRILIGLRCNQYNARSIVRARGGAAGERAAFILRESSGGI